MAPAKGAGGPGLAVAGFVPEVLLAAPTPPVNEGDVIADRYRVQKLLAWGGMGVVFAAQDTALQRKVALKVVRSEYADNEEAVTRFLNEARAAATLKSEHIARVLDVGQLPGGMPFMVLEFLEGSDLAQLVRAERRLGPEQAVDFLLQACEALAEAHRAGIIHRDLKPENLFVSRGADGSPVVKVLDFGISKRLRGNWDRGITNPASSIGSPLYMSPEQMKSPSNVDARSDIWSMGAVLFELLAGKSPFDSESMPEVCAKVLSAPAPSLLDFDSSLPEELDAIVQRCLAKEPAARFASVAELARALEPFGATQTALTVRRIAMISGRPSLAPDPHARVTTASEGIVRSFRNSRPSSADLLRFGRRYGVLLAAAAIGGAVLVASRLTIGDGGSLPFAAVAGARITEDSVSLTDAVEPRLSPSIRFPVQIPAAPQVEADQTDLVRTNPDLGSALERAAHETHKALRSSPDRSGK